MRSPGSRRAGKRPNRSGPLRQILPFLKPFRGRIAIAGIALIISSAATLVLPAAGRQLIDHGFDRQAAGLIGQYFLAFIAVAAVMGVSGATRFYFVTWIGERVVADIRKAVFANVLGLTPEFFEVTRTGEVLSRLTADTTLIQTVVGSTVSVALRNLVTLTGAFILMFVTSPKLAALVVGAVFVVLIPLIFFGRWVRTLSRKSQDRIADTSARASETLHAVQTVQAFTHENYERTQFSHVVEGSFDVAVRRTRARAVMAGVVIFAAFSSIACVLLGWCAGCDRRAYDRRPASAVHLLRPACRRRHWRAERSVGRIAARGRRVGAPDGIAQDRADNRGARASQDDPGQRERRGVV